ncbi:hypothetical protein ATCV1_z242R [Acanthocystis turfacea chlorella virus 1]|uniref:Uncharacterized protein z242R n=1 Tax=Chlorovirus heliozoae TaxID=322019 RepID=A7K8K2_9PHYC|nr:hypothetical protein ATCV1_z242R [Acanthocystis turfacea chlorella virus 1]ABT16376.1 hypothetical protein ATCV1_z242R [Acanthocystis turfacea chlorella virus 1]
MMTPWSPWVVWLPVWLVFLLQRDETAFNKNVDINLYRRFSKTRTILSTTEVPVLQMAGPLTGEGSNRPVP